MRELWFMEEELLFWETTMEEELLIGLSPDTPIVL